MKKLFFFILVIVPAVLFAAGLRIDFKVLMDRLQNKQDPNIEAIRKMGIDPAEVDFQSKPWWTFKDEDNLLKWLPLEDLIKKLKGESDDAAQVMRKKLGSDEGLTTQTQVMMAQARATEAQVRANQAAMEQRIREVEQ